MFDNIIKKLLKRYLNVGIFIIFFVLITTLNLSWLLMHNYDTSINLVPDKELPWMWIGWTLSYVSAVFGMLNVMTYSIIDFDSKHVDKFKIFIIFNSIAVLSLAIMNGRNNLWFLLLENIFFFGSGVKQYYQWFITPNRKKKTSVEIVSSSTNNTKNIGFRYLYKKTETFKLVLYVLYLIATFIIATILSLTLTVYIFGNGDWNNINNPYSIISGFVDGLVFSLSFNAALLVGSKSIDSQWMYLIGDIILIGWWLFNAFGSPEWIGVNKGWESMAQVSAINLALLFGFYLSSNIVNIKNWPNQ